MSTLVVLAVLLSALLHASWNALIKGGTDRWITSGMIGGFGGISGLIVALAQLGGDSAQIALGMPKVVTGVFNGILLFMLLAGETFNRFHVEIKFHTTRSGKIKDEYS